MIRLPAILFLAVSFAIPLTGQGKDERDAPARRFGVIFEGTFEKSDITVALENARKTQLVAYYEWDFGVRPFTEKVWNERGLTPGKLMPVAKSLAADLLQRLEPEFVRDARGVILYAVLSDKDPFLTSVLLSPRLIDRFQETLGDRIHAVLIDRHRIYLFPATGGRLLEYGPALVEEFRRTPLPVSLEVFLIDESGYLVIGELERPNSIGDDLIEPGGSPAMP